MRRTESLIIPPEALINKNEKKIYGNTVLNWIVLSYRHNPWWWISQHLPCSEMEVGQISREAENNSNYENNTNSAHIRRTWNWIIHDWLRRIITVWQLLMKWQLCSDFTCWTRDIRNHRSRRWNILFIIIIWKEVNTISIGNEKEVSPFSFKPTPTSTEK